MAKKQSVPVSGAFEDDRVEPWARQRGESSEAFSAWLAYRDMAGRRSARRVSEQSQKSQPLINRWAQRWRWTDRLRLWQNHLDGEARRAQVQAIVEFRQRAARQLAAKAATLALLDRGLRARLRKAGDGAALLSSLTVKELLHLNTVAARVLPDVLRAEALALGDRMDRAEVAAPQDGLSKRISGDPELLSLAASLVERASVDD